MRVQFGALPYRLSRGQGLEILLVTTRQSGRWIIPKGGAIKGLTASETAAQEAYEEAGIRGIIKNRSVGSFRFDKNLYEKGLIIPCEVFVFPLQVKKQLKDWPEKDQRICRWFDAAEAVLQVQDDELAMILWRFLERKKHDKSQMKGIKRKV